MNDQSLFTYEHICDLCDALDTHFLELGRLLREAQKQNASLFKAALKTVGRRKAYYLIAIDEAFNPLGIEHKRLVEVGWTKLTRLTEHVNAENVDELLELALRHTDRQLIAIMSGRQPIAKAHIVQLALKPKQYKRYAKALLKHGATPARRGLANQEKALMALIKKVEHP